MLISIVMPVYNNEKYVIPALMSVISQKVEEIEIIVIDDGSTDNTPAILDTIASKYDFIKVIHQKNQWIYASFNNGIKAASGKYVYILNSDDKLAPSSLNRLIEVMKQYNFPDVIWTKVAVCTCDEKQNISSKFDMDSKFAGEVYVQNLKTDPAEILLFEQANFMTNQANLYKRELMLETPFRNDVYGADYLFNLELAPKINSCVAISDEIYLFHQYTDNSMNASCEKYYGYEQTMFNDFYLYAIEMLKKLKINTEENINLFRRKRRKLFTSQITALLYYSKLSIEEKMRCIFGDFIDETLIGCFDEADMEELDSRVLSALRNFFVNHEMDLASEYYFVYELVESLLRYEKDEDDLRKIKYAVYNELNPKHIGEKFFLKCVSNV